MGLLISEPFVFPTALVPGRLLASLQIVNKESRTIERASADNGSTPTCLLNEQTPPVPSYAISTSIVEIRYVGILSIVSCYTNVPLLYYLAMELALQPH